MKQDYNGITALATIKTRYGLLYRNEVTGERENEQNKVLPFIVYAERYHEEKRSITKYQ